MVPAFFKIFKINGLPTMIVPWHTQKFPLHHRSSPCTSMDHPLQASHSQADLALACPRWQLPLAITPIISPMTGFSFPLMMTATQGRQAAPPISHLPQLMAQIAAISPTYQPLECLSQPLFFLLQLPGSSITFSAFNLPTPSPAYNRLLQDLPLNPLS
ncbi:hypothetical protein L7F22_049245 [Adiantum nelumboides]|nr:hypothetical protein [Adiantum nelumboides]